MAPETHAAPQPQAARSFKLPIAVSGLVEIRQLRRELEQLEEFVRAEALREAGKQPALPRTSKMLDSFAADNGQQLLQTADRQRLIGLLKKVEETAPSIHMSFAVEASAAFTAKVVSWLRANVHPYALLEVGLQPTIAAGCILRTNNKVFDFSLRHRFEAAQTLLVQSLEDTMSEQAAGTPQAPAVAAAPEAQ